LKRIPLSTCAGDDREDQVQWRRTPLSTFFYLNLMLINMLTSYRGHEGFLASYLRSRT
jgi:hypothetical protein